MFAAFAEPEAKARWFGAPPEWETLDRALDFRVGGEERSAARMPDGTVTAFRSRYEDIVPNERIVFSYGMRMNDVPISVSLTTVELRPAGEGTRLIFTEQGAFLDGYDDAGRREEGTRGLLENLGAFLTG